MCTGGEPKCGKKDNRGREVPLEGIGVFGMEGCRRAHVWVAKHAHLCPDL
jgi:hypothetical protein